MNIYACIYMKLYVANLSIYINRCVCVCVCVCDRASARVCGCLKKKMYINTYEHMYVYMLTYADV
jgi:hypothetical protein